jgi:hypothetical protein
MHVGISSGLVNASDYVNHEIFVAKLRYCHIQGTVANWFRSYLTDRKEN